MKVKEGKHFIKTVEDKEGNGYFLSHGLTQNTFESSDEFEFLLIYHINSFFTI